MSTIFISARYYILSTYKKYPYLWLISFTIILGLSFYSSFKLAIHSSKDMQWYGAVQFAKGINPYSAYLENGALPKSYAPNYGHLLYLVLYPFALLNWEQAKILWAFLGMFAFVLMIPIAKKNDNISIPFILLISGLLIIGYPLSNSIGNGQNAILMSFLAVTAWTYRKSRVISVICLSLLFTKYSFGVPILIGFYLAGYKRETILAVLVNIVAAGIFALRFHINIVDSVLFSFKVSSASTGIGPIDLMSLARHMNAFNSISLKLILLVIYGFFSFTCLRFRNRIGERAIITGAILLSLSTFFHLGYDHIMFIVAIIILRSGSPFMNFGFLSVMFLSIFLWWDSGIFRLLGWNITASMDTGIVFDLLLSTSIIALSFYILFDSYKHNRDSKEKDNCFASNNKIGSTLSLPRPHDSLDINFQDSLPNAKKR